MSALPGVSVVVPAYNAADVLDDCLRSLAAQSYPAAQREVIVVDNESTDGSRAIVARHAVRCIAERRRTSYAARSAGVRAATHDLVAFIDADCVAGPAWLVEAVAAFADARVGCVCGPVECLPPRTWVQRYQARRRLLSWEEALHHPFRPNAQTANAVYRRAVFDAVGLFEETWPSGGDADLGWRMLLHSEFTLEMRPAAIVYHRHRATLAALLRQRFRHGRGRALLDRKYAGQRAGAGAVAPPDRGGFWNRPHRRGLWRRDLVLEVLSVAAFHLGRLSYPRARSRRTALM